MSTKNINYSKKPNTKKILQTKINYDKILYNNKTQYLNNHTIIHKQAWPAGLAIKKEKNRKSITNQLPKTKTNPTTHQQKIKKITQTHNIKTKIKNNLNIQPTPNPIKLTLRITLITKTKPPHKPTNQHTYKISINTASHLNTKY